MSSRFNEDTIEEMNEDDDEDEYEEERNERAGDGEDDEDEGFSVLSDLPVERSERRPTCRRCW